MLAQQNLAFFLDTMPVPDHAVAQNVYGVAFGAGRRHQMKLNGPSLARQLDQVKLADIQRVARMYFAPNHGAGVAALVSGE
jgi:hypothetical protein